MTLTKTHKKKLSESTRKANYVRWRRERGIKLVMSIVPWKDGQKIATCIFEGKQYAFVGATHTEALDGIVEAIIKEAKLNE